LKRWTRTRRGTEPKRRQRAKRRVARVAATLSPLRERVRLCLTNAPADLPPSPGTPGEGRGGGYSRELSKQGPHPNPPPEYREREYRAVHPVTPG
jgi:hypothetical protein